MRKNNEIKSALKAGFIYSAIYLLMLYSLDTELTFLGYEWAHDAICMCSPAYKCFLTLVGAGGKIL